MDVSETFTRRYEFKLYPLAEQAEALHRHRKMIADLWNALLQQAPAAAAEMLRYKAEEAGIRCDVVDDVAPKIAVGGELVAVGRQLRHARRQQRKVA